MGDHPVVANLLRTGTPDGKEAKYPRCPWCGAEAENFYRHRIRGIIGCDRCLVEVPYYEIEQGECHV